MFQASRNFPSGWVLINTPKKLWWLRSILKVQKEIAFDVETTKPTAKKFDKVSFPNSKVCGVSLCWAPGHAVYVPMFLDDDGKIFWKNEKVFDQVIEIIAEPLENPSIDKFAQNGKFDIKELYRSFDIRVSGLAHDTMLAHHLLDEEGRECRHGLKDMAEKFLGAHTRQWEEDLQKALDYYDPTYRRYSKVPIDVLYPYGCSDADHTFQLALLFENDLENQRFLQWDDANNLGLGKEWGLYPDLVIPSSQVVVQMELRGLKVDIEKVSELEQFYTKEKKKQEEAIYKLAGKTFDVASPAQLGDILFEDLKLPGGERNKIGWGTDKHVLKRLANEGHEIAKSLQEWRSVEKLKTSYVDTTRNLMVNGRVYPQFWIHGTVTGRWSASDPAIMTLPREENGGDLIKAMFVADEGYSILLSDYSQLEIRIAAHCSNERAWIDDLINGQDLHSAMAYRVSEILGNPLDCDVSEIKKKYPEKRSRAKILSFGILYGQTVQGLKRILDIPLVEAEKLISAYFSSAPRLKQWIDETHLFLLKNGYVTNIFGRKRRLPDIKMEIPRFDFGRNLPKCFGGKQIPNFWDHKFDIFDNFDLDNSEVKGIFGPALSENCVNCERLSDCAYQNEIKRREFIVEEQKRQGLNFIVQSSAVDIVNLCLVKIHAEIRKNRWDACPILQIHDELGILAKDDCIENVQKMMKDVMTHTVKLKVPLEVVMAVVKRWSDKK